MRRLFPIALFVFLATSAFAGSGRIVIINVDPPQVGLNDPTPVAPIGGNPGRTLGEQRMIIYQAAAERWSAALDTNVDILAEASFASMECSDEAAVLGGARSSSWNHRNFPNAPLANTWYPVALANALAGVDLLPGQADIVMRFNADLDKPTCLGSSGWYYGLDGNHGNDTDLFVVVLHELAHGLGVSAASSNEVFVGNMPSVFDVHTMDVSSGQRWPQMSQQQRKASMTSTGNLAWDGDHVRDYVARFLEPVTTLTITAPSAIARNYDIGTASFGPVARTAAMSGQIVRAVDAINTEGPSSSDGCTAFTNAAAINGNVALIDRGTCPFVAKARNAQAAGAIGVVIVDNTGSNCSPPGLGGDAADVTIPIVSISTKDGDLIKAQLTANLPVSTMLRVDPSQLAGTSQQGYMRLYAPCEVEAGSTKHHWDTVSTPNLLMEPAVNGDVLHGLDLTLYQLLDMGWREAPRSGRTALRR